MTSSRRFWKLLTLECATSLPVRRLPLGARRARAGPGALPRGAYSRCLLSRHRTRPFVTTGFAWAPPVAERRAVRRGSRAGRDRRRRLRGGVRVDGRSRTALVAAAALRPRRLCGAGAWRVAGPAASRRGGARATGVHAARPRRRHDRGRRAPEAP